MRTLTNWWTEYAAHFTYHLAVSLGYHPRPTTCPWCRQEFR